MKLFDKPPIGHERSRFLQKPSQICSVDVSVGDSRSICDQLCMHCTDFFQCDYSFSCILICYFNISVIISIMSQIKA